MTASPKLSHPHDWPWELHWDQQRPLPTRWVAPRRLLRRPWPNGPAVTALNFSERMLRLCEDVAARCPVLQHIQMAQVLVTFTLCRNRSRYGLQARLTPLRFRDGQLQRHQGSTAYQIQRFFVNNQEILYILTFCLPRFLDQSFRDKLITVFHELYHMSPQFDGDLRRHPGRCTLHSRSKDNYDRLMSELVERYLAQHPQPEIYEFLQGGYRELWSRYGGIIGVIVPRPKLLPVGMVNTRTAARRRDAKRHRRQ
ncbi:MAG: hypothetical protein RMJ56_16590 [Gemmataceae bacterium]|nr:hypothetical protein [Gemmata sp.]MDW8199216.1 hypothetical protein [Gemmataceae bacterium]